MIDLKLLIKNGVHFGHQKSKWSPKMKPYIWGHKSNIHLIDVSLTAYQLEKAAKFLESVAAERKPILWVGTKKAAQDIVYRIANELNCPYVIHRWVGGTFSNYRQVRKSVAKLLHYEDILSKSEQYNYSKKELNEMQKRIERLKKSIGGIRSLTWPIGAVVVVDIKKENVCVREASTMGIPVVALVDTNSDPSDVDYVIPANDDAPRSINILLTYLGEAVKRGQEVAATKPKEVEEVDVFESVFEEVEPEEEEIKKKKDRDVQDKVLKKVKSVPKRTLKKLEGKEVDTEKIEPETKVKTREREKEKPAKSKSEEIPKKTATAKKKTAKKTKVSK